MIIAYTFFNAFWALLGKEKFRSWINPITLYALVWEIAVGIHESGLIVFYELTAYTWAVILFVQVLFSASCLLGIKVRIKIGERPEPSCYRVDEDKLKRQLKKYIVITTVVAGISVLTNLYGTINRYGTHLLASLTDIYAARVYKQDTVDTIPYIGSFIFIALPLCGVYLKKYGFSFLAIPAFILVFFNALNSGGRAGIVFSMILFASAYFVTDTNVERRNPMRKRSKFLLYIGVAVLVVMVVVISIQRNAGQVMLYASPAFEELFGNNILLYKALTYIAGPIGVLNEYLKTSELHFGQNTFLTVYNLLYRLGIGQRIDQYQEWFFVPLACNVGSWIRELIEDFSLIGASCVIVLFGYATSRAYINARRSYLTRPKVVWAILSLVLILSFFDWKLRSSNMWIALCFGCLFCSDIDKKSQYL